MALVELCNLESQVNVYPFQKQNELAEPEANMNLVNPMQLALPPLGNVRIRIIVPLCFNFLY